MTAEQKKPIQVPPQVFRLIGAAKKWAAFQEPDSLRDQETDPRLASEAEVAKDHLLAAIEAL